MNKETFIDTYDQEFVKNSIILLAASAANALNDLQFQMNLHALKKDQQKVKQAVMRPIDLIDMTEILEELFIEEVKTLTRDMREKALEALNRDFGYER